ncbi:hypothetical protein [Francisella sp. SYW-2]|uniref:hypothetical protein n=1 Tax=Francisella sp. SYW-2 TaxID=2610886 RepID=UPI00123DAE48|nr:hypothetical protein [Francisella sp. SYW-2]
MDNNHINFIPYHITYTDHQGERNIYFITVGQKLYSFYSTSGRNSHLPAGTLVPFKGFENKPRPRIRKADTLEHFSFWGNKGDEAISALLKDSSLEEKEKYRDLIIDVRERFGDKSLQMDQFLRLGSIEEISLSYFFDPENYLYDSSIHDDCSSDSESDSSEELQLRKMIIDNAIVKDYSHSFKLNDSEQILFFDRTDNKLFKKGMMLTNTLFERLSGSPVSCYDIPENLKLKQKNFIKFLSVTSNLTEHDLTIEQLRDIFQSDNYMEIFVSFIMDEDYFPDVEHPMVDLFEEIQMLDQSKYKEIILEHFNKLNSDIIARDLYAPQGKYYIYKGKVPEDFIERFFEIRRQVNDLK